MKRRILTGLLAITLMIADLGVNSYAMETGEQIIVSEPAREMVSHSVLKQNEENEGISGEDVSTGEETESGESTQPGKEAEAEENVEPGEEVQPEEGIKPEGGTESEDDTKPGESLPNRENTENSTENTVEIPISETNELTDSAAEKPENGQAAEGTNEPKLILTEERNEVSIDYADSSGESELIPQEEEADSQFRVSEILPAVYTGKAIRPEVQVFDENTLLKLNRDYKVTYENNINVNTEEKTEEFSEQLPYVIIEGKGNYEGILKVNFEIRPAEIGNGSADPGEGVKLSYADQLSINEREAVDPFNSISHGRKMKPGQDFVLTLEAVKAYDREGASLEGIRQDGKIPAGSSGTFRLTITGVGNYSGSIVKEILVSEESLLLKNAQITLGRQLKTIDFATYKNTYLGMLQPGYYDSSDGKYYRVNNGQVESDSVDKHKIYTVKCGNRELIYGKDFTVSYANNQSTGTATMTIHGAGQYVGSKSVTFRLIGKAFNAKTIQVEGMADQSYTGEPITQDAVTLTYIDENMGNVVLQYGKDYTISYSANVNKGTATMTFIAVGDSGYQGSFKETFKINAADVKGLTVDQDTQNISVEYEKSGAKPAEQVVLRNSSGKELVYGKDYTLLYKNNRTVAQHNTANPPTIIVRGKGNYFGQLELPFTITKASLSSSKITVVVKEMAYNPDKADDEEYRPAVIVKDGKKILSSRTDYLVRYENNTQAAYKNYYLAEKQNLPAENAPKVIITAREGGNYTSDEDIVLELPIYQVKFSSKSIHVVISAMQYNGRQCTPEVEVYYAPLNNAAKAKGLTSEEEVNASGLGLIKLDKGFYQLEYGSNLTSGKNAGSIKITGSGEYGGTVIFRFDIAKRSFGNQEDTSEPDGGGNNAGQPDTESGKEEKLVTEKTFYANDETMGGYDYLKDTLKNQILPQTIKAVLEDFPQTFSYLDQADIGIGLLLFDGELTTKYSGTLAYVAVDPIWNISEETVQFELGYGLGVNYTLASFEDSVTGELTAEGRAQMEGIIVHEMMHAMMFEALSAGMLGRDHYAGYKEGFPNWFVEGTAQAVGGGADTVRKALGITADLSESEIQAKLSSFYLDKDNYYTNYGTGYLAVMYLGYLANGTGSVASDDIAAGLDRLLNDIRGGKSLEKAIADNTKYEGIADFKAWFAEDAASFTKRLMTEAGDGLGALAAPSYKDTDILANDTLQENIFHLNITQNQVINAYPEAYTVISGGFTSEAGLPGPGHSNTN